MMHVHDIEPYSEYCLICGAGVVHIINNNLDCVDPNSNIVAISHIVRGQRLRSLIDAFANGGLDSYL